MVWREEETIFFVRGIWSPGGSHASSSYAPCRGAAGYPVCRGGTTGDGKGLTPRTAGAQSSMGLYRLVYSFGGAFDGVLLVEANSVGAALWQAHGEELDPGSDCHCVEVDPEDARNIPLEFIGHLLDQDEAAELDRMMVERMPKRPPVPSVRRPADRWRRR